MITYQVKIGQNPNTIITLPDGKECVFKNGKYQTDDARTAGWLNRLGYDRWTKPVRKPRKKGAK